ncbi:hypothetical protein TEA_008290 [Camellia sinensis var. sinensis]|uniref:CRA domain-containing protein n=1 Tax=Camellia sinensis var. sinensis TaxID=542762 RepID=A0A4S4D9V4_CAMSN|nr:hypothetical protein TEA_008290 [Camellia sinensis var. sinensis]
MTEVQKLMACLLWAGRLDTSPYSELLSSSHWDKLAEELTRQFCNILGQSCKSPLNVTIAAGVQGLPTLLKLMNVMTGKKQEWQSMKQLPVPVDLDREFQFHSIFVCPVSRDQANEKNPPMLLSCGHVLFINKIDQSTAVPDRVKAQLKSMFDLDPSDCLLSCTKTGSRSGAGPSYYHRVNTSSSREL